MSDADPTRIIVRNMSVFVLRGVAALRQAVGDQLSAAFIFATVRCANVSHTPYTAADARLLLPEAGEAGDHLRRGVSVNAVARSFAMPYETVRSCVNSLIARDLMERRGDGVLVPGRVLARPAFRDADEAIAVALLDAFASLARLGIDLSAIAGPVNREVGPPPQSLIARIATDAVLRASEAMLPSLGDLTSCLVYCGAAVMSSERLISSSEEAWRYAAQNAPPPESARQPVSMRALAASLDLPFETTRRHANDLVAGRLLLSIPGKGVVPHPEAVSPTGLGQANMAMAGHAMRILTSLAKLGFDFADLKV